MSSEKPLPLAGAVGLALGSVLLSTRIASAGSPKLLVFVHVAVKQRALQALLQSALPGLTVSTVGRVADFDRGLEEGQDAVLTLPIVMQAHGLTPKLRGQRGGSAEEKYCLVGADAAPDPGAVGALDQLGREGTNAFVAGLVGSQAKVERVTKVEDLLPLLQMQRVDAVLLPARLFTEIRSTSSLNLVQRELAGKVGLPAIASVGDGGAQAINDIGKLAGEAAKALGVESWK